MNDLLIPVVKCQQSRNVPFGQVKDCVLNNAT